MKQKKKKKLMSLVGLGVLLVHNNVSIDIEKFGKLKDLLAEEFDGDNDKALEFLLKEYNKMLNKVLGDDSIENK